MSSRAVVLLAVWCLGCGRLPKVSDEAATVDRIPTAVLVEREIAGDILGEPLRNPLGLAVAAYDAVFVVDAGNNRLIQFGPDLMPQREVGGYGFGAGAFNRPSFVVVDNVLNLMVSDEGNRRIARYDSRFNFVDEISFTDDQDPLKFGSPSGVAVTDFGEVWVADRENGRIAVFDNVGKFDRFVGDLGYSGHQLLSPEKIAVCSDGRFVVCDAGNSRLAIYDVYGNFSHEVSDGVLEHPIAVAVDGSYWWVLDGSRGVIVCFDPSGNKLYEVGPNLMGIAEGLKAPSDIVVLSDDRLLISDSGNNRLLVCRVFYEEQEERQEHRATGLRD